MDPRAERSRRRALDAASHLLVSEGLDAITHLRVAEHSGVGRRTLYRHWPDRRALLHDVLSQTRAPEIEPASDLRTSLESHLAALEDALVRGPLALIVSALHERSRHDDDIDQLRDSLVRSACAPLEERLRTAARRGELPRRLDVRATVAALEGPVFHAALLHRQALGATERSQLIDAVLAHPPTRRG